MKTSIEKFLSAQVALMKTMNKGRYNGWSSTGEFVLHHGKMWTKETETLPDGIKPMKLGECFRNAALIAMGFHRNEYLYCEGYAISILPVPHAWCIDLQGNVIDPTWTPRRGRFSPIGSEYFGIAFKSAYLFEALHKRKVYGLIDAWEQDWPLLKAPEELWKHQINHQKKDTK